jgi:hypothetical protein
MKHLYRTNKSPLKVGDQYTHCGGCGGCLPSEKRSKNFKYFEVQGRLRGHSMKSTSESSICISPGQDGYFYEFDFSFLVHTSSQIVTTRNLLCRLLHIDFLRLWFFAVKMVIHCSEVLVHIHIHGSISHMITFIITLVRTSKPASLHVSFISRNGLWNTLC